MATGTAIAREDLAWWSTTAAVTLLLVVAISHVGPTPIHLALLAATPFVLRKALGRRLQALFLSPALITVTFLAALGVGGTLLWDLQGGTWGSNTLALPTTTAFRALQALTLACWSVTGGVVFYQLF